MEKTTIITGASGNLGSATVKAFLDAGHTVIASGNSAKGLDMPGNEKLVYRAVNLMQEAEATAFVEEMIHTYGTVHGGLLLAGGFAMGGIEKTDGNALKRMYGLNFETAYYVARPLFTHMMEKGYGRIVFVGSRPVLQPQQGKGTIAYTLSKSLLFHLASLLNAEAKGTNVVTSVIVPSTMDTPQNRESMPEAKYEDWVKPEDIAALLEFICGDKALSVREPVYKIYGNA